MIRQNYLIPTFSEIALQHYQILNNNYQQLKTLDKMCSEAIRLQSENLNNYVVTITFAAMSLEAFLNDYAAQKMGDEFYYENFENLRPFAKLQLIAKVLFNIAVDKGGEIYSFMTVLFRNRNELVHCKSKKYVGLSEEEYQENKQFFENDPDANSWLLEEIDKIDLENDKKLLDDAYIALRALKAVANFIDEHDSSTYATSRLLCAGWLVEMSQEKLNLIASAQRALGVEPLS